MSEDYKNMLKFGQDVFVEGLQKYLDSKKLNWIHERDALIRTKRMAVVNCVHGIELILKALLVKKGYIIYKFKRKIFRSDSNISNLINKNLTIDMREALKFFKKEHTDIDSKHIFQLNKLRNQIIHHGINIDDKKKEYFIGAITYFEKLYEKEHIRNRSFLEKIKTFKETM
jgi:hypothetical protein